MLYKNNGGKTWWAMFRDPRRPGKFIRKSTGTSVLKDARSVEQAMHLSIKGQITEQHMKDVLSAIFAKETAAAGLPLAQLWPLYEKYVSRRDRKPNPRLLKQRHTNLDDFIEWSKKEYPVASAEEVTSTSPQRTPTT